MVPTGEARGEIHYSVSQMTAFYYMPCMVARSAAPFFVKVGVICGSVRSKVQLLIQRVMPSVWLAAVLVV